LLAVLVTPASIQDRVAARALLLRLRLTVGDRLRLVWADGGYTGTLVDWARRTLGVVVEIVKRPDLPRFTVLPRRWVVERTLCAARRPVVSQHTSVSGKAGEPHPWPASVREFGRRLAAHDPAGTFAPAPVQVVADNGWCG
jgi:transposase